MELFKYTEKSIAVFGDTQPFKENLKALGGKYNANLRGQPGWIFTNDKLNAVTQFVDAANAGVIQPIQTPVYNQMPQQYIQPVPRTLVQPTMSPQTAMQRLATAQPMTGVLPQIQPLINTNRPLSPKPLTLQPIQPVQYSRPLSPKIASPKPVAMLPQQPQTLNFPNTFTAGDGLNYQIVIYTCPMPSLNQKVTLIANGENIEYEVTQINPSTPIDDIHLTQVIEADELIGEAPVSRAVIINGKWQIHGMQDMHTLVFH